MTIASFIDERVAKAREDAINQLLKPENLKKIADVLSDEVKQYVHDEIGDVKTFVEAEISKQTSEFVDHLGSQTQDIVTSVTNATSGVIEQITNAINSLNPFRLR